MELNDVLANVQRVELERSSYVEAAAKWERMWRLEIEQTPEIDELLAAGRKPVVLPQPYNTVQLGMRLVASEPRIEVPADDANAESEASAERRERFLSALWQRANKQQRRDVVDAMAWQAMVRGRWALEVKWVEEELPDRLRKKRLPVLIRNLDPLEVGVKQGPLFTEFAYHKWRETRVNLLQQWPDLQLADAQSWERGPEPTYEVIDYWWTDRKDGSVWNCIIVDRAWAKPPEKTRYPDVPIVEGYGDSAPLTDEEFQGISILHPIGGLWEEYNRVANMVGTGLLYHFHPIILVTNDEGHEPPDLKIGPARTTYIPPGTKVDVLRAEPNVPLAERMMSLFDRTMQEGTFPGVLYGQSPGELQAGFGVSILSDAARGRINQIRKNIEGGIEHANEIVLGLIDAYAPRNGVTVWGKNAASGAIFHETIKRSDVRGFYENLVTLTPQLPNDDMQRQMMGLRLVEGKVISRRTFRDKYAALALPSDEQLRVELETVMEDPAMRPKVSLAAVREYYPETWPLIVRGTQLEQLALQEEMPPGMTPPGAPGMPAGGPEGMMPPGGPAGMMPPGAPGMMPPGGPGMMPPGGPGGMPPGAAPMLPGVPPEMQAGMTPEMLMPGMSPEQMPPGMFQQLMGQPPLPPDEELRQVTGLPDQLPL